MHDYQSHILSNLFPHERKIKLKITNNGKPCSIHCKQESPPVQASALGKQQHRQIDMLYIAEYPPS